MKYEFGGYATRNDLKCADGRVIRRDAFKECDGATVPLVWAHVHDDPTNVLGHAVLENRDDGVYAYCSFNESPSGQQGRELVKHGDITALSIYANHLKQQGSEVLHGIIREVSLVMAGANPGATIDNLAFAHGDSLEPIADEAVISPGDEYTMILIHADDEDEEEESMDEDKTVGEVFDTLTEEQKTAVYAVIGAALEDEGGEEIEHADDEDEDTGDGSDKTVGEVFDTLTEEQKTAVYAVIGAALEDQGEAEEDEDVEHSDYEGDNIMKYNVFDEETGTGATLTHDDMTGMIEEAKRSGSLRDTVLEHGITNIEVLFPEVHGVNNTPFPIMRRMEWVSTVINGTRKSPFSRIKSTAANFTMEEARARGYIKGTEKQEEQFAVLKRITTPTTVYKLQKLDRDDIIDITDFDVVSWMKDEMRTMLDEEMARAILIGDGRVASDPSKINPMNIRPVWTDEDVFAIHHVINVNGMTIQQKAQAFVDGVIRSKLDYKGSGTPTMFIAPELLVELRLLRDGDGYRRYKTDQELADDLRVSKIVEVELFNGLTRTVDSVEREMGAIILNMNDYTVGATKGGEVTMFDDFNLDFNKYEYLIETRCCGALTMPYSAIVVEMVGEADYTPTDYQLANIVPANAKNPATAGFYYFDGSEYVPATETTIDQGKIYYSVPSGATGATGETGSTGETGATGSGE